MNIEIWSISYINMIFKKLFVLLPVQVIIFIVTYLISMFLSNWWVCSEDKHYDVLYYKYIVSRSMLQLSGLWREIKQEKKKD